MSDTPLTFPQIEDGYNYVSGLFLGQDRLAVIYTQNAWGTGEAGNWYETNQTHVLFYDTADITVDSSCCAGVTPEKHEAALETMRSCQINVK